MQYRIYLINENHKIQWTIRILIPSTDAVFFSVIVNNKWFHGTNKIHQYFMITEKFVLILPL